MKECSKCHKLLDESYFSFDKGKPDGLSRFCKECANKISKEYYSKNKENKLKYQNNYRKQNIKEINEKKKIHYHQNRDKITAQRREKYQEYKNNSIYKLNRNISKMFWDALKSNKAERHWEDLVPYTLQELKQHLESQFDENMSWNNMGSYWEIDHIIPKNQFNYISEQDKDFKLCWSLLNLRPLEKIANRSRPKDGKDINIELRNKILNQYL